MVASHKTCGNGSISQDLCTSFVMNKPLNWVQIFIKVIVLLQQINMYGLNVVLDDDSCIRVNLTVVCWHFLSCWHYAWCFQVPKLCWHNWREPMMWVLAWKQWVIIKSDCTKLLKLCCKELIVLVYQLITYVATYIVIHIHT